MKSNWKKLLSLALVLALMVGFAPGMDLTVRAANAYSGYVNTTTTVRFNNMDWYIIADESTAADAGTVTLLTKEPIGAEYFLKNGPTNSANGAIYYKYSSSTIKAYLDGLTDADGSFAEVADAIAPTDLTDEEVTGVKLYLLSKDEASGLISDVLKCAKAAGASANDRENSWWLRGRGNWDTSARRVRGTNASTTGDFPVGEKLGVRPALRLDLSKVVFSNNTFALPSPVASVTTSGGTTTEYAAFSDAVNAWADGSTLTLLDDVTTSSTISVSGTKTLDLNGRGIRMTGSGSVINVGGASLTLNDSAPNAQHKYTIQNPKSNGAGLAVVDDANGTQTFTGGYLTGGDTNERGGVVVNGGSLTMNGGTVIGNNAALHGGGALDPITQAYGSTVTLSDIPSQPTNHPDYAFSLWNTAADGTGTPYASDASFTLTADLTLYAQWTDKPIYTVSGTVKQGGNTVSGVTVRIVQGERKLAVTETDAEGAFSFSAPEGSYNLVAELGGKSKTELVTLSREQAVELALPAGNVNSVLTVTGSDTPNVVVGGLDAVAAVVDTQDPVTVTMTVEQKEADEAAGAGEIQDEAGEYQTVDFLSIEIEMQVGSSVDTVPDTGEVVLEIIVPYSFSGKENVEVYRYHAAAAALEVLDSRPAGDYEDGTCYLDRDNGLVYIYASRFSTYAIGYTQCYNITGAIRYGSYTGSVIVSLEDGDGTPVKQMTISLSEGAANYSFTHVLAGKYYLNATWSEGNEQILPEREILVR